VAVQAGDRIEEQARSTEHPAKTGTVEEVIHDDPSPRYRIRWDDGHESVFSPAAGSLHKVGVDRASRRSAAPLGLIPSAHPDQTGGFIVGLASGVELKVVAVEKPEELNLILGQSHFIKTVEDLHEALVGAVPGLHFGIGFCEASGPRLVRTSGSDPELVELAARNALTIGAGHSFIVFLRDGFPVNVLNQVKLVPEVCRIYCATANSVQVIIAETEAGRGIVGVIDGGSPRGVEAESDIAARKRLLREFGYKL